MADALTEVQLLREYSNGLPLHEAVPAVKLDGNRYRIAASPGFAPGVANGDEIEFSGDTPLGYRVVKRGGNLAIQLFLNELRDDDRARITARIEAIGGWLDGGLDEADAHLLIYTVPVSAGFDIVEGVMSTIERDFDVDDWLYGNVYDTRDGVTPLNWWLERGSTE